MVSNAFLIRMSQYKNIRSFQHFRKPIQITDAHNTKKSLNNCLELILK